MFWLNPSSLYLFAIAKTTIFHRHAQCALHSKRLLVSSAPRLQSGVWDIDSHFGLWWSPEPNRSKEQNRNVSKNERRRKAISTESEISNTIILILEFPLFCRVPSCCMSPGKARRRYISRQVLCNLDGEEQGKRQSNEDHQEVVHPAHPLNYPCLL